MKRESKGLTLFVVIAAKAAIQRRRENTGFRRNDAR